MSGRREEIFWDLIGILGKTGFLPHVMIIGSWAEFLYAEYYQEGFHPNLRTHDIDVFYTNPFFELDNAEKLRSSLSDGGFLFYDMPGIGSSFIKEGMEVEFLLSSLGGSGISEIPCTGIFAEKLDDLDMLVPMLIDAKGYTVQVPTPFSYIAHKLLINPKRRPESKRPKDIEAVRELVAFIRSDQTELELFRVYLAELPSKRLSVIRNVARANSIELPLPHKEELRW